MRPRVILPAWHGAAGRTPRSHARLGGRPERAGVMTRTAVEDGDAISRHDRTEASPDRPGPLVASGDVVRIADRQGHPAASMTHAWWWTPVRTPSWSPTTGDASWTARKHRWRCSRRWWTRWAAVRRCWSTAECEAAPRRRRRGRAGRQGLPSGPGLPLWADGRRGVRGPAGGRRPCQRDHPHAATARGRQRERPRARPRAAASVTTPEGADAASLGRNIPD
jgi:hypothetical protein